MIWKINALVAARPCLVILFSLFDFLGRYFTKTFCNEYLGHIEHYKHWSFKGWRHFQFKILTICRFERVTFCPRISSLNNWERILNIQGFYMNVCKCTHMLSKIKIAQGLEPHKNPKWAQNLSSKFSNIFCIIL